MPTSDTPEQQPAAPPNALAQGEQDLEAQLQAVLQSLQAQETETSSLQPAESSAPAGSNDAPAEPTDDTNDEDVLSRLTSALAADFAALEPEAPEPQTSAESEIPKSVEESLAALSAQISSELAGAEPESHAEAPLPSAEANTERTADHNDTAELDATSLTDLIRNAFSMDGHLETHIPQPEPAQQELTNLQSESVQAHDSADVIQQELTRLLAAEQQGSQPSQPQAQQELSIEEQIQRHLLEFQQDTVPETSVDAEAQAQQALIDQLTAAIGDESQVPDLSHAQDAGTGELDASAKALADLLSAGDLEATLTSLLAQDAQSDAQADLEALLRGRREDDEIPATVVRPPEQRGPKSSLSIAETLAITRSNMQKSRERLANRIDPMLSRQGYMHSWSTRPSSSSEGQDGQQSAPAVPPSQIPQGQSDADENMMTALLLAKQMIGGDDSENVDTGDDMQLDGDALQAVQDALQALTSSLAEGDDSSQSLPSPSRKQVPGTSAPIRFSSGSGSMTTSWRSREAPGRSRGPRSAELTAEDLERIRELNRERKKRWRGENSLRNKDNDLRARLHRRSTSIFGAEDSPEKAKWFNDEFQKRRQRRILREMQVELLDSTGADVERSNNSSQSELLRQAIQAMGRPGESDLSETFANLSRDPQLLRGLVDALSDETDGGARGRKFRLARRTPGGLISTFKIKTPTGPARDANRGVVPQMPSKLPDRGLTSLIKGRGRGTSTVASSSASSGHENSAPSASTAATTPAPAKRKASQSIGGDVQRVRSTPLAVSRAPQASPKPPSYLSPTVADKDSETGATSAPDDRVQALGFPPMLAGMVKR